MKAVFLHEKCKNAKMQKCTGLISHTRARTIYNEGELNKEATVSKMEIVCKYANKYIYLHYKKEDL